MGAISRRKVRITSPRKIINIAMMYSTHIEFQNDNPKVYTDAYARDMLDEVCRHMLINEDDMSWQHTGVHIKATHSGKLCDYNYADKLGREFPPVKHAVKIPVTKSAYVRKRYDVLGYSRTEELLERFERRKGRRGTVRRAYKEREYVNHRALPTIMYYIKIIKDKLTLYKIGITTGTVETRFSKKELRMIQVLKIFSFKTGYEAFAEEQSIIKENSKHKYRGCCILKSGGNTELFTRDVLNLDKGLTHIS